ncbi:MAG TPA: membrane dipeptidase, partial [Polyangiaceae bacterium]|nr:membrane dipeptidase [Polyangiaceae bacterium]
FSQRFKRDGCKEGGAGIGTWLSLEAPDELAREPAQVGLWTTRGVRLFAIGGTTDNGLASSATPTGPGAITGLTAAGRDVVKRILEAGALVDVSNASELSIDEVTQMAEKAGVPVVAGHSNARALADAAWNLSDPQIRGIAKTGGVVGVTARHGMLATGRNATMRHLVEQIRHMVRVAGPDHVAIGSSFEDGVGPVADFKSAADYPRLARALSDAGLSQDVIERVFYKNALRVLCPTEAPRAKRALER